MPSIEITCHCGAARQRLILPHTATDSESPLIPLCHCTTCRHTTGQLLTSYQPIASPPPNPSNTSAYFASPQDERYFCTTCGCHLFRRLTSGRSADGEWAVATGTIVSDTVSANEAGLVSHLGEFGPHVHVQDTKDGGLSPFLPKLPSHSSQTTPTPPQQTPVPPPSDLPPGTIPASCHCALVTLYITPPNATSRLPTSPLSDLIIPFHTSSSLIPNKADTKWWLRTSPSTGQTKYLAGTCACASCRLISGFEIQSWAFIPRANIFIRQPDSPSAIPINFDNIPSSTLAAYESSPGVLRNFCPCCGATIFWHDGGRPELIDVSVGLLWAESGARAEEMLMWWGDRVSFREEAGTGRDGEVRRAVALVGDLEEGIKGWEGEKAGDGAQGLV